MKMINKPLKIVCADIYLRFPEIMEDEYKDLIEFIEDNNIVYKSVSNKFKEQEQEIARLNKTINKIKKLRSANTHVENIYYAEGVLLNEPYCDIEDVYNEELLDILRGDE